MPCNAYFTHELTADTPKNIVAFGFLYAVIPWVTQAGYIDTFGTQAGIYVLVLLVTVVPTIMFGRRIRHVTAGWKVILS